jgi:hypothetical protein
MKNYFEKNKKENLQVHGLDIYSHRESRFKNSTILAIVLAKSKIEENKDFKKSKIEEMEV